jgi:hypothetical protein
MQAAHVDHVELPQHPVQHPVQANQMLAVQHPPAGQPHEEDEEEEDEEEEVVVEPYYQSNEHGGLNDDAKLQQVLDIIHQGERPLECPLFPLVFFCLPAAREKFEGTILLVLTQRHD